MKRFLVVALMAAFILGTVGMAHAIEIKAKGQWRVHFNYEDNWDYGAMQSANLQRSEYDRFSAWQRMRTQFEFVANENLKGVLQLEIGNIRWGQQGFQAGAPGRGVNVKTRLAYLDFNLPNTQVNVKAGRQAVGLPSTMGSLILDSEAGAVLVHTPFTDMLGLTLGWARAYDFARGNPDDITEKWDDEVDVFMAVLPVNMDGLKLNPFFAYSRWGKDFTDTDKNANMFHAGLNFDLAMLDPVGIRGDFNYGTVKWNDDPSYKQSGWFGLLAVQYAMDMVTPQLFGWYESGEDADYWRGGDSKRMPTIETWGGAFGPGVGYGQRTAFAGDSYLRGVLLALDLAAWFDGYWADPWQTAQGAVGTWGTGVGLRNIKFVDNVSHDLVGYYMKGTNHTDNLHLFNKDDTYWEVCFNNRWQMYENLALIAEFAYGKLDLDDRNTGVRGDIFDKSLKLGKVGFFYSF